MRFAPLIWLTFLVMGIVQFLAIFSFFNDHWNWGFILSGMASLFLAYFPIVGAICGFIGAIKAWYWEWWQAGLLFFWYPVLFLTFNGIAWIQERFESLRLSGMAQDYRDGIEKEGVQPAAKKGNGALAQRTEADEKWATAMMKIHSGLHKNYKTLGINDLKMKEVIADIVVSSYEELYKEKIDNNEEIAGWMSLHIANFAADNLESGKFHVYRGVLGVAGNEFLEMFKRATKSAVEYGILSSAQAKKNQSIVLKSIKEAG